MTEILFERKLAEEQIIDIGWEILKNGGIIVIPTDTIPGIGCAADNREAVKKIFDLKERPENLALPVIIADSKDVEKYVVTIPYTFYKLTDRFWPGPLTVILQSNGIIDKLVGGGKDTLGFRIPDSPLIRGLIRKLGKPLALTSANPHNLAPSAVHQKLLSWWRNEVDLVVLGRSTAPRVPSAVIDLVSVPPKILREGIIPTMELEALLY
jgi:L-threonylcarbamoyladenylate synthase